jgi:uncharacterized protein YjbI with pentapeptide repeats
MAARRALPLSLPQSSYASRFTAAQAGVLRLEPIGRAARTVGGSAWKQCLTEVNLLGNSTCIPILYLDQDAPMANDEHVAIVKKGVAAWNAWRNENPNILPDLRKANLRKANLRKAKLGEANLRKVNLRKANLRKANLSEATLYGANLIKADLRRGDLRGANLSLANLRQANLRGAYLSDANLTHADLTEADLRGAYLYGTTLVDTNLTGADLTGCCIYGVSAWRLTLKRTKQQNLVITDGKEPEITVDNVEVAQFIYLLLNNQNIRRVVDTVTSKAVLILGRFTQERKPVLEALRKELRQRKYLPILFDFEKSKSRNTDETITLLARMARFVVADISDAKSVLQELRAIVPDLPSVPVQPIILAMQEEPGMFDFYRNFRSFLNVHRYASQEQLIADLGEKVIRPAELKVLDLQGST